MRILLVDDEEDILEGMLAGIDFAALGFDWVHTAGSAQEAREILEKEPVDILLTDIEMPGESGLELLDWLRQQNSDIVTMFCTSYANFDYAKKAVEMHSFDYYLKPISYDDLRAHLEAAVREVRKKHSESAYRQMGEYWLKGPPGKPNRLLDQCPRFRQPFGGGHPRWAGQRHLLPGGGPVHIVLCAGDG